MNPTHFWKIAFAAGIAHCLILERGHSEPPTANNAETGSFTFYRRDGEMDITLNGQPFAVYVWEDSKTTRPYFKHVRTPDGIQVTRNHPPKPSDYQDHETYHPGIWWGFGDIDGNDYWRMKAKVRGGDFIAVSAGDSEPASFSVKNRFLKNASDSEVFLEQTCRYTFLRKPGGVLLIAESVFRRKESAYWLGDQEEMGLAFRVHSQLAVARNSGSKILNAQSSADLQTIRTTQSNWVDYSGPLNNRHAGLMLMSAPGNFRKPWWHAVDTGLLVANPFGKNELNGRGKLRQSWWVPKDEPFRLRYGIYIHSHPDEAALDRTAAYQDFLNTLKKLDSLSRRKPESPASTQ